MAVINERCAYGVCDEDEEHSPDCTAWKTIESRIEVMQRLMWESFSARYHNAERAELERFPKLKAAWDEWQAAWCAGVEAHISTSN